MSTSSLQAFEAQTEPAHWLPGTPTDAVIRNDPLGWFHHAQTADSGTSQRNVQRLAATHLSARERGEIQTLMCHPRAPTDRRTSAFPQTDAYEWSAPTWSVMVKANQRVVTHAGIVYRVIQVGDVRVPVGGISGVRTLDEWRGHGYARAALANAVAFVAVWLWAPFAVVLCPRTDTAFYEHLGWRMVDAPIWSDQPTGRVSLANEMPMILPCQGAAEWPRGSLDLCGLPW